MSEKNKNNYMVSVYCGTFNQKSFITEAMKGIAMQQTNFPYICTLVDDASTDGQQEIIKEFFQNNFDLDNESIAKNKETDDYILTFAQHKTNRFCFFVVIYLKYNHYSKPELKGRNLQYISEWFYTKYRASCEGDDWWTDEFKLQKLVSFLESHPKYVLACHRINRYIQEKDHFISDKNADIYFGKKQGVSFGRYYNRFVNWKTQTLATVYRSDVLDKSTEGYPYALTDGIKSFFPLKYGKGYCFNEHMATYRVNQGGVWSRLSQEDKLYTNWRMFKRFDDYEKSVFSKLSYWEAYSKLLKETGRKGYKDAKFKMHVYLFGKIYDPLRRMIIRYYKLRFKLQK